MSTANSVTCPHCGGAIANDPALAGQVVQCPHCQRQLTMPSLPTAKPVQAAAVRAVSPPKPDNGFPSINTGASGPVRASVVQARNTNKKSPVWLYVVAGFFGLGLLGTIIDPPKQEQQQQVPEDIPISDAPIEPIWKRQHFSSKAEREEWIAQEAARRAGVPVETMRGWDELSENEKQMRVAEELLRREGFE